jgi:hypothetical protein
MPVTQKYQVDIFAIIVLIVSVFIFVFLIISSVYFMNISNFNYPSQSEALFLFWTTIILCVIIFGIIIFAFYKIYSHKSIVFDAEKHIVVKQNNKSYNNKSYSQKPIQVKYSKQPSNNFSTSSNNYQNDVVKIQPRTPYSAIVNNNNDNDNDNDNDNELDL